MNSKELRAAASRTASARRTAITRAHLLQVAYHLAKTHSNGLAAVERKAVCAVAGVGAGTVNYHFQTMKFLRDEVLKLAIADKDVRLVAQGILEGNPLALTAPRALRRQIARVIPTTTA